MVGVYFKWRNSMKRKPLFLCLLLLLLVMFYAAVIPNILAMGPGPPVLVFFVIEGAFAAALVLLVIVYPPAPPWQGSFSFDQDLNYGRHTTENINVMDSYNLAYCPI